ncbi:ACT domain-containing protein ACR3 isoform X1 [Cajanus cajan]|uniref:ACT domain-containing protein ACR3 isoform X1 n=2 Tax=Cajanus cajan TaxID=3821 RepID=UPI00098DB061|nr:ACT domain-containing protein ACR3 isoform X1 [Cajanus cajan]XP_020236447.1 ACT domain-containing protein ACR3 isoform X1 [Cajanus cajan]XP_020236462.1 ACT domain-containing protein ACR3 isoform X1 [Cajanus cajan]XP_020236466.1 ACT domain-containing protein ACR3 isoform X1 [Cajanus cajan]XP_020236474.1 ACT domain-containing protein ACR3 isoform X1 [Cajanus cajan]XP_029130980.1 ACT domain-containing protein ACR3 isoform X1 [Cajanus cajan]XP_029130985.1 ACT domain-containing protein ACR3 iso
MAKVCWPYFDPEYENFSNRINPPRVSVDNDSCHDCTLIKFDSINKPGILLEVVQILTDLDFIITKAYISSDGGWFMDVFHVTDQQGKKITDSQTIDFIEKVLGPKGQNTEGVKSWQGKRVGVHSIGDHTAIELIGRDRPGLLSEISAVLASLQFNVIAAEVWTHNRRIACVLYVNDATNQAMDDSKRLSIMEEQLNHILRGCQDDEKVARTSFSMGFTHMDRRLHQMLFADRDYESAGVTTTTDVDCAPSFRPKIRIERIVEKGYSVVSVRCKDRAKLMFDIVCTLTDMQYVVFHATISSEGLYASQEYFIRHMDGCTLDTEGEKERVIKCIEAAIQRRVSEGVSLELCAKDRVGLLSEVTRILRENGLTVSRAGVSTVGEKGLNVFYVRDDASGNPVDMKIIEALRKEIGQTVMVNVKRVPGSAKAPPQTRGWAKTSFFFGNLFERFLT